MTPAAPPASAPSHTEVSQRIGVIDGLRGFALWGILVVNVFVFHAPYFYYGEFYTQFTGREAIALETMILLFPGKFMYLFAFLFGYGAFLQFSRWRSPGSFLPFWFRRMGMLAVFGGLHLLLFWMGDILFSYALLGFALPLFFKWRARFLFLAGFLLYFTSVGYSFFQFNLDWPAFHSHSDYPLTHFITVFSEGSYAEIFWLRLHEIQQFAFETVVYYLPREGGLFLVGMAAAKVQLHQRLNWKIAWVPLLLALLGIISWNLTVDEIVAAAELDTYPTRRPPLILLSTLAEWLHGASYILLFFLLWRWHLLQRLVRFLAPVGRMALSNYFFQSLVCVLVFYGYGAGQYGSWTPIELLVFAGLLYLFQAVVSIWWLKKYAMGPLEWLWRKASYSFRSTK